MLMPDPYIYSLEMFEGPLDLMWQLLHRHELDILHIPLIEIMHQFLQNKTSLKQATLDQSAEFIAMAAALIWYKSKTLLPQESVEEDLFKEELASPFENIQYLVDYCVFKELAKNLSKLEEQQEGHYSRGIDHPDSKKNLGIEHLSLEDLGALFQKILVKCASHQGIVHEDEWRVGDKITLFREILTKQKSIHFTTLFSMGRSRQELIVMFLALLELMKTGDLRVIKESGTGEVSIEAALNG